VSRMALYGCWFGNDNSTKLIVFIYLCIHTVNEHNNISISSNYIKYNYIFMVVPCILESLIDYLSPTNAIILTLFNLKY
jgi:hypothetical protein